MPTLQAPSKSIAENCHKAPDIEQAYTRASTKSQPKSRISSKQAPSRKEDTLEGVEEDGSEDIDTSNSKSEVIPESPENREILNQRKRKQKKETKGQKRT